MQTKIDGLKIYYKVSGSGKNLLFLHGWHQDQNTWNLLAPYLAEKYKVWRIDLPGFGLSEMPENAWGTPKYADFLDKFIRSLKIRKLSIIAHSFGARPVIFLAGQRPAYLDKLVLISTGALWPIKSIKQGLTFLTAKVGKIFFSIPGLNKQKLKVQKRFYQVIKNEDYLSEGFIREVFEKAINEDLRPVLSKVKNQTLIVWGKSDKVSSIKNGRIINKKIKKSELAIIPKSEHFPYIENQVEFVKVLEKFLVSKK